MMWRRIFLLDLVLVVALVAGVLQVRRRWIEFDAGHHIEAVSTRKGSSSHGSRRNLDYRSP